MIVKHIISGILSFIAILFGFIAFWGWILFFTVLSPSFYDSVLQDSGVYDELIPVITEIYLEDTNFEPVDDNTDLDLYFDIMETASVVIEDTITPEFLRTQMTTNLNGLHSWLLSDEDIDALPLGIDLSEVKQELLNTLTTDLEDQYEETPALLLAQRMIQSEIDAIPDYYSFQYFFAGDNSIEVQNGFLEAQAIVQLLHASLMMLTALLVMVITIIALIHVPKWDHMVWWSTIPLLALSFILLSLTGSYRFSTSTVQGSFVEQNPGDELFINALLELVSQFYIRSAIFAAVFMFLLSVVALSPYVYKKYKQQ